MVNFKKILASAMMMGVGMLAIPSVSAAAVADNTCSINFDDGDVIEEGTDNVDHSGPKMDTGMWDAPYIYICDHETKDEDGNEIAVGVRIWSTFDEDLGTVDGFSYDLNTNTLTITNVTSRYSIETNEMGEGFKIKVVGNNSLRKLYIWGFGWGGSCTITGTGTLKINEDKESVTPVNLCGEGSVAEFKVDNSVNLEIYAMDNNPAIEVSETESDNPIQLGASQYIVEKKTLTYEHNISKCEKMAYSTLMYVVEGGPEGKNYYAWNERYWENEIDGGCDVTYDVFEAVYNEALDRYIAVPVDEFKQVDLENVGLSLKENDGDIVYSDTELIWLTNNNYWLDIWENSNGDVVYLEQVTAYDKDNNSSIRYNRFDVIDTPYGEYFFETEEDIDISEYSDYKLKIEEYYINFYVTEASEVKITATQVHTHSYQTSVTKAKKGANGSIVKKCECGKVLSTTTIAAPATVKLNKTSFVYNGKSQKPTTITVLDSSNHVIKPENYTITYSTNTTAAGVKNVKITFKSTSNYSGYITGQYTINKADNNITATGLYTKVAKNANQSFALNAKAKGGTLTYKSDNSKVTVDKNGKVNIAKNYVGTAKITVSTTGNTNYKSFKKIITIKINPATPNISTISNVAKGAMKVVWNKLTYVTGYQLQYSTSSAFDKGNKTITISNPTAYNRTISGLTKNRTYYVRIRTYKKAGKTTYYSTWSARKYVKITR